MKTFCDPLSSLLRPWKLALAHLGCPADAVRRPTRVAAVPDRQTTADQDGQGQEDSDKNEGTSNDRLFYALPNFLTLENSGQRSAAHRRAKVQGSGSRFFRLHPDPWYASLAGISQAENSEPGYGQGAERLRKAFRSGLCRRHHRELYDRSYSPVRCSARIPASFRQSRADFGIAPDTRSAASLSPAPIPGISNSTSLRLSAVRRRPPFPPTATIRRPIALCRTPPASGGRR